MSTLNIKANFLLLCIMCMRFVLTNCDVLLFCCKCHELRLHPCEDITEKRQDGGGNNAL